MTSGVSREQMQHKVRAYLAREEAHASYRGAAQGGAGLVGMRLVLASDGTGCGVRVRLVAMSRAVVPRSAVDEAAASRAAAERQVLGAQISELMKQVSACQADVAVAMGCLGGEPPGHRTHIAPIVRRLHPHTHAALWSWPDP